MITDLKDLQKLLKLCRAQGITDFKMNGLEIKFGDLPIESKRSISIEESESSDLNPYDGLPNRIFSPEELTQIAHGNMTDLLDKEAM